MKPLKEQLEYLRACYDAREWVGDKSLKTAWAQCRRGDWMLWLAAKSGVDRRLVVLAACDCAEQSAKHWSYDSKLACIWSIDAARRWATGDAEIDEVMAAAYAASAASASSAAAYAANAAAYAASAASAAAYASSAAAYAASAANADAARKNSLANSAKIVRKYIPYKTIAAVMRKEGEG